MNNPHIEMAEAYASYSQNEKLKLEDRQIYATLAPAEAALAVAYELRQNRQQAKQGPSHTGAAPVTSGEFEAGDWVRVTGPDDDPLIGKVGRVRLREQRTSLIDFPGMQAATFNHAYLEPAPKLDSCTPRH